MVVAKNHNNSGPSTEESVLRCKNQRQQSTAIANSSSVCPCSFSRNWRSCQASVPRLSHNQLKKRRLSTFIAFDLQKSQFKVTSCKAIQPPPLDWPLPQQEMVQTTLTALLYINNSNPWCSSLYKEPNLCSTINEANIYHRTLPPATSTQHQSILYFNLYHDAQAVKEASANESKPLIPSSPITSFQR